MRAEPEVRQPERAARQGRRAHVPAPAGGVIDIRELSDGDVERIGERLPLHRLPALETYLIAWDGDEPVGQAHIAWARTKLGLPEIQDVFVLEARRREGIASALALAAERAAAERGHTRVSLSHSIGNVAAKRLYARLGYRDAGIAPEHVRGVVRLRNGPVQVDDTLVYLVKDV